MVSKQSRSAEVSRQNLAKETPLESEAPGTCRDGKLDSNVPKKAGVEESIAVEVSTVGTPCEKKICPSPGEQGTKDSVSVCHTGVPLIPSERRSTNQVKHEEISIAEMRDTAMSNGGGDVALLPLSTSSQWMDEEDLVHFEETKECQLTFTENAMRDLLSLVDDRNAECNSGTDTSPHFSVPIAGEKTVGIVPSQKEVGPERVLQKYLFTMMHSKASDFSPTPLIKDSIARGKYEHLLDYAQALHRDGQLRSVQDIILLATAYCFYPLADDGEIDRNCYLPASILKHCNRFARNQFLLFLQAMLRRSPSFFTPYGESLKDILIGFSCTLQSYSDILAAVAQARQRNADDKDSTQLGDIFDEWKLEHENAMISMCILVWLARQPRHWEALNGAGDVIVTMSNLAMEPKIDRPILEFIIEYMSLNAKFLPAVDSMFPQNVVLEIVISGFEYSAKKKISSLRYPDYMLERNETSTSDGGTERMVCATLSILCNYAMEIPATSMVLPRFTRVMTELLVGCEKDVHRQMTCVTAQRLFRRYPREFDVTEEFVRVLSRLYNDRLCGESASDMLMMIYELSQGQAEAGPPQHESGGTLQAT